MYVYIYVCIYGRKGMDGMEYMDGGWKGRNGMDGCMCGCSVCVGWTAHRKVWFWRLFGKHLSFKPTAVQPTIPPLPKVDDTDAVITSECDEWHSQQRLSGWKQLWLTGWKQLTSNNHTSEHSSQFGKTVLLTGVGTNEFKYLLSVAWTYKVLNAIKTSLTVFQAKAWERTLV